MSRASRKRKDITVLILNQLIRNHNGFFPVKGALIDYMTHTLHFKGSKCIIQSNNVFDVSTFKENNYPQNMQITQLNFVPTQTLNQ